MTKTPKTAYIIIADGEVDQVCETQLGSVAVMSRLHAKGHSVYIVSAPWEKQDAVIDRLQG